MHMKSLMIGALATALGAAGANAEAITVGSGWQFDQASKINTASENSPWTFTVPTGDTYTFSLTDALIVGDVYTVTIDGFVTVTSTFTLYPTTFDNDTGPGAATFAPAWLSDSYSHLQLTFTSGAYSLVVKDIKDAGLPAGFGVRVDGIPEASTWAMLLAGFAGLGYAGYRGRRSPFAIA